MVKNEIIAILALVLLVSCSAGPSIEWRRVPMDGHRTGVTPLTADNLDTALGVFTDQGYVTPSGVCYSETSAMAAVAATLLEVQPKMAGLKQVVGHSAKMMMNDRETPDLPLGNLFADVLRAYGSAYYKVPMDLAITNYGGIRVPMPEGPVTLDDITSMFPFKNYLCYVRMKGSAVTQLFEQLSGTKAFQAISGAKVMVKGHKLQEATVGGQPIDPNRIYNVTTIDFLLDGGDQLRIGAMAESVKLSRVLLKDVMLSYVEQEEAAGRIIDAEADGRVIMED